MQRDIFIRLSAATLLAVAVSGCVSSNGPPTAGGRRVTYACEGAPGMTVIYAGDVARIEGGNGQTLLLQRKETERRLLV